MRRFLAVILSIAMILMLFSPARDSLAIEAIKLLLTTEEENVKRGDLIEVKLSVNRMPHILKFEDLGIDYDENSLSYVSYSISDSLAERFAVVVDDNGEGLLRISGNDEAAEDRARAAEYEAEAADRAGDEDPGERVDTSFDSTEPVEICSLLFRVKPGSYDTVSFVLEESGAFYNSGFERIDVTPDQACSFNVVSDLSNDAHLRSIKINGTALADFNPDVFEYYYNVPNEVGFADIEVEVENLLSEVSLSDTGLVFGDNVIYVDVLAQDGIASLQYKLTINRQEAYTRENASFFDNLGRLYYFVMPPEGLKLPKGFTISTTSINGYEVPCYVCDGVTPILVYVFDEEGYSGLYFLDKRNQVMRKYDPENTFINTSSVMSIAQVPEDIQVPDGYIEAKFPINGKDYDGYINDQGKVLLYLESETGHCAFYSYDFQSQYFRRYEPVDTRPEKTYKVLFRVCLLIAIFEAVVIILIVYFVRRFLKERVNPRPRRV